MDSEEPKFIDKIKAMMSDFKINELVQQSINTFARLLCNLEYNGFEFLIMTDPNLLVEL